MAYNDTLILVHHLNRGQFHQHFTCSFYAHRSQKHKNTDSLTAFFALLGSGCIKAEHKMLMKLTPADLAYHRLRTSGVDRPFSMVVWLDPQALIGLCLDHNQWKVILRHVLVYKGRGKKA